MQKYNKSSRSKNTKAHKKHNRKKNIYVGIFIVISIIVINFFYGYNSINFEVFGDSHKRYTVVVDAGHGGYDPGAIGINGEFEKDITLKVALRVGKILKQKGIRVVYTRDSDDVSWPSNKEKELQERCRISNEANADIFISIHCNATKRKSNKGIETLCVNVESSKKLAKSVQAQLSDLKTSENRGVKVSDLYVIKHTVADAALVELGFISNEEECEMLTSNRYVNKYAEAIVQGILNHKKDTSINKDK